MSEVVDRLLQFHGEIPPSPPTLLLGQFERVGSTFYCDQLEKTQIVHNEPYKLLLPPHWPIARGYNGPLESVDEFFADDAIAATDKHWMRNFVTSLHYPGNQVVKETNLYLALPQFLELFPHSQVELLTRNPLGIISSFKRNDLYRRWNYAGVTSTLQTQLEAGRPDGSDELSHMLEMGQTWEQKLAWMIGLNAVLLSRHVRADRVSEVIAYERDVIPMGAPEDASREQSQDSIFATNIFKSSDDFEKRYTAQELDATVAAMQECADFVVANFGPNDTQWFNVLYAQHLAREYRGTADTATAKKLGRVSAATETQAQQLIVPSRHDTELTSRTLVQLDADQALLWDYSLITNEQMGDFLQRLIASGQQPTENYFLLLDNMPPSRGGRITFDQEHGGYKATEGFDQHPAYWVTWLAASLYAYKQGMRLPYYDEWLQVYQSSYDPDMHPTANHTYVHDDTTPTGVGTGAMPDDFFGNLKIWCADWSNEQAVSKNLAGISWKHYLHDDYSTQGERPYLTNSRVIGARLVCCSECAHPKPRTDREVMEKFDEILSIINRANVQTADDLASLNAQISDTITPAPCEHQTKSKVEQ